MARRKCTKKKHANPPRDLQTLISLLRSAKDLKPEVMKCLYSLLVRLCSTMPSHYKADSSYELDNFRVKFQEIREISNILFKKLELELEEFLSAVDDASFGKICGQSIHLGVEGVIELLTLLLRCCIVIVPLLDFDGELSIEKSGILLLVLRRMVHLVWTGGNGKVTLACGELVFPKSTYIGDDYTASVSDIYRASVAFSESCDPCCLLLSAMLEVFSDELLMHRSVRQHLFLADMISSPADILFTCPSDGNIGIVLEVLSAHFILSLSGDQTFEDFLNKLFWKHDHTTRVPEMSLSTALSLLCNPVMFSAPKMFQAHLISRVSDVVGIKMSMEHIVPDASLMNCYFSAFQWSIIVYTRHASYLQIIGDPVAADDYFSKSYSLKSNSMVGFESHLKPATRKKVHDLIIKYDNLWDSYLHSVSVRTTFDLVALSVAYMKDSLHVFPGSCKDVMSSIMSCIVHAASDVCEISVDNKNKTSPQDIYLLASILKLMSCSLLQIIRCLTQCSKPSALRASKSTSSCREYDVIIATIKCFGQFNIHLPSQNFLQNILQVLPGKHKESKWMLLHFSGLLSLSYSMGIDFLVKDCILLLMILLELYTFEDGNLDTLQVMFGCGSESLSHKFSAEVREFESSDEVGKASVQRKPRRAIALRVQKIQKLDLCLDSQAGFSKRAKSEHEGSSENVPGLNIEPAGKTSNGKAFLSCVIKDTKTIADLDGLADFIECQEGKDYSGWLRGRENFRQRWVAKKMEQLEKAVNAEGNFRQNSQRRR